MYKEVAIDPQCLADFHYYSLIKMEFGFEKGRYISASLKQWAREAYPYVKNSNMPTVKKKSVKNFLNKLMKSRTHELFLLAGYRSGVEGNTWLDWWKKQSEIAKFAATISEQPIPNTIDYMSVIDGAESWKIKPSELLGRNPNEIVDIIEPLLRISKSLIIVDQYFSFATNKTLLELFKRLSRYDYLGQFQLLTSVNTANPLAIYEGQYKHFKPVRLVFTLTEIPEKYIHDRYVISDVGALKAGYGFKEGAQQGAPSDTLSVNLLSIDEAQFIRESIEQAYVAGKARDVLTLDADKP